jgi:hypothetical protein
MLVGHLVTSNLEVLGVNDYDIVTVIGVRRVGNLRLAHELVCDYDSQLA